MASFFKATALGVLLGCSAYHGVGFAGTEEAPQPRGLYSEGRYLEAAAALVAETDLGRRADLLSLLVRTYYELGKYRDAIEMAERWVELEPASGEALRWLGKSFGRQAEESSSFILARKVKRAFEAAVEAEPRNVAARRDLLQFLARAPFIVGGSKRSAQLEAEAIGTLDPVEGHLALGLYRRLVGDEEGARAAYDAMLGLAPSSSEPYFEMAEFGEEIGDRTVLGRALAGPAGVGADRRFSFYEGVASVLDGECAAARKWLSKYLAEVPPHSELPPRDRAKEWLARCEVSPR